MSEVPINAEGFEKSVLSSMLQEPEVFIPEALKTLTAKSFYKPSHAKLFEILTKEYSEGRTVELVRLNQILTEKKILESLGGPSALAEIYTYSPSSSRFASYCEDLKDMEVRRDYLMRLTMLRERAKDRDDKDYLSDTAKAATEMMDAMVGPQEETSNDELVNKAWDRIRDKVEGKTSPVGISTGYPQIDSVIKGFHGGRVWIISAKPSCGKSALASLITWKVAKAGTPTLFVSMEMTEDELIDRVMIPACGLPALALSDPIQYARNKGRETLTKDEGIKIKEGGLAIKEAPFFIHDETGMTMEQISNVVRLKVRKEGVKLVAIDYAQLIRGATRMSREEMLTEVSRQVQQLAKDLKIDILLLSQENAEGATKFSSSFGDDASAILRIIVEQDSDAKNYKEPLGILVAKDRYYGMGGTKIDLFFNSEYFEFMPWKEEKWKNL